MSAMILPPDGRPVTFGHESVWLDSAPALYMPDHATLVVTDLHLAKGSAIGRQGIPLPLYDSRDTLARLETLLDLYRPARLILLGDSFHDRDGWMRLPADEQRHLEALISRVQDWYWVAGNHDPDLELMLPGQHATTLQVGRLHFSHQPIEGRQPLVVGHYHPKASYRVAGIKVQGKAFVLNQALLIMPAFGTYTGGLDLADPVYRHLVPASQSFVIYRGRLWHFD